MKPSIYLMCLKLSFTLSITIINKDYVKLIPDADNFHRPSSFTNVHFSGSQKFNRKQMANWIQPSLLSLKPENLSHENMGGLNGKVLLTAIAVSEHRYLRGYFHNLMRALEEAANFTTKELEVTEEYGSWNEKNKTWSGAIGLIVNGKVDLITSWIVMDAQRLSYVDYTVPLKTTELGLWIKKPMKENILTWHGYIQPFTLEVWAAIILLSLAANFLLAFINIKTDKSHECFFCEDFLYIWGSYCKQSLPEFPKRTSVQMIYCSILLFAFFILSVYSACLVSGITLFELNLPFETLEGFVKDGSYKLCVMRDASDYDSFRNAKNYLWKKMNRLMIERNDLPKTTYDAWTMICSRKVAFFGNDLLFGQLKSKKMCSLVKIRTGRYSTFAMTLRKDSPYTKIINYYLSKYRDSGVLDRIDSKFYSRKMVSTESIKYNYNAITFNDISPLLLIVIGGILLSSTILILEKIYSSWHQKSKTVCSSILPHVTLRKVEKFNKRKAKTIKRFKNNSYFHQAAEAKNQRRTLHTFK